MPIVDIPDRNIQIEFPDDMSAEEIQSVIQAQVFGGPAQPTEPVATPPTTTAIEESEPLDLMGIPSSVNLSKELVNQVGGFAAENAPMIGAMAAPLLAGTGVGLPVAAGLAGLGAAGGLGVKNAFGGTSPQISEQDKTLMDLGLPFAPSGYAGEAALGAGAQVGGGLALKVAGKLMAPAAGKLTDATKSFINWANERNLPFSADIQGGFMPRLLQGLGDTGLGRFFGNAQRQKLARGATEAASDILEEVGLPQSRGIADEAMNLKSLFKQSVDRPKIYAGFNEAIGTIPKETPVDIPALSGLFDEDTLALVGRLYGGTGSRQYIAAKRIATSEGTIPMQDLDWFSKNLWKQEKGWFSSLLPEEKAFIGKLKGATLEDMETLAVPELGQTVGALRKAADQTYKDALEFLNQTPLAKSLAGSTEQNIQRNFFKLYSEPYKKDAIAIRNFLTTTGQEDTLKALDSAYLESVFNSATKLVEDTGERMFMPGKFIDWYNKHGKGAAEIMPEYKPALEQWLNISKNLMKDYSRMGGKSTGIDAILGGGAAGGLLATGHMGAGILVPTGFSLLASLGTMGRGNLGFLRNYLLKETVGPMGQKAASGIGQGAKMGIMGIGQNLIEE